MKPISMPVLRANSVVSSQVPPSPALVKVLLDEVLPVLQQYFVSANFDWKGQLEQTAREYAACLAGKELTASHIRKALDACKALSLSSKLAPNPVSFMLLCLQAKGMPTLAQVLDEMQFNRVHRYGKPKRWQSALAYWLSAAVCADYGRVSESELNKRLNERYHALALDWAAGTLPQIPLFIEHKVPARCDVLATETSKSLGAQLLAKIRAKRSGGVCVA